MEGRLDAFGNQLYYELTGSGAPVLLIHGYGLNADMWAPTVAALEAEFTVLRYDLRGHGRSDGMLNEHLEIKDTLSLLDSLGLAQVHVVGLSLGAMVALDLALTTPQRVHSLVLASPGLIGGDDPDGTYTAEVKRLVQGLQAGRLPLVEDALMALTFQESSRPPGQVSEALMHQVRGWVEAYLRHGFARRPQKFAEWSPIERLPEVWQPTLIIAGEADLALTRANAQQLADSIPAARLAWLPEVAHLVNLEAPEAFNKLLLGFLRSLPTPEP